MRAHTRRPGRTAFAFYICSAYVAILLAAPMVRALEPAMQERQARMHGSASAGGSAARGDAVAAVGHSASGVGRTFEDCDRNGDGVLDKSEAGRVPGLSAYFERADLNQDGKLDRGEFEKALGLLASRRK